MKVFVFWITFPFVSWICPFVYRVFEMIRRRFWTSEFCFCNFFFFSFAAHVIWIIFWGVCCFPADLMLMLICFGYLLLEIVFFGLN